MITFKCISAAKNLLFTQNKRYNAREVTGGHMVVDDIGYERFISNDLKFLVTHESVTPYSIRPVFAYFLIDNQ